MEFFFFHRKVTEKIEKPNAEAIPKKRPISEFFSEFSNAITDMPKAATIIDIHTVKEILSFKNINPSNAVINGIAAKHNNVIAAVVFEIDQIKVIIAVARPAPPIIPEIPIFR